MCPERSKEIPLGYMDPVLLVYPNIGRECTLSAAKKWPWAANTFGAIRLMIFGRARILGITEVRSLKQG